MRRLSRKIVVPSKGNYITDDYTNWRQFVPRFVANALFCLDHALWTLVNYLLLSALSVLALVLGAWDCVRWVVEHPLSPFVRAGRKVAPLVVGPVIVALAKAARLLFYPFAALAKAGVGLVAQWVLDHRRVLATVRWVANFARPTVERWTRVWPPPPGAEAVPKPPLSAVNADTPNIHTAYCGNHRDFTSIDLTKERFDLDNAIFFLHLSALVYENKTTLAQALDQWHLRYKAVLQGQSDYTGCAAWIVYHSTSECQAEGMTHCVRSGQDFLVVVFRGTSPFDCVDWMTDFTMLKVKPYGESLPGMVHEGFFREFEWPHYLKTIPGERKPQTPARVTDGYVCDEDTIRSRLAKNKDWTHVEEFTPPLSFYERLIRKINWVNFNCFQRRRSRAAMWITGHSMGGALASIFFAHLLHVPKPHPLELDSSHDSVTSKSKLHPPPEWLMGGYTFGAPCTGDRRYAEEVKRPPRLATSTTSPTPTTASTTSRWHRTCAPSATSVPSPTLPTSADPCSSTTGALTPTPARPTAGRASSRAASTTWGASCATGCRFRATAGGWRSRGGVRCRGSCSSLCGSSSTTCRRST
jgi:hypothetical protein